MCGKIILSGLTKKWNDRFSHHQTVRNVKNKIFPSLNTVFLITRWSVRRKILILNSLSTNTKANTSLGSINRFSPILICIGNIGNMCHYWDQNQDWIVLGKTKKSLSNLNFPFRFVVFDITKKFLIILDFIFPLVLLVFSFFISSS